MSVETDSLVEVSAAMSRNGGELASSQPPPAELYGNTQPQTDLTPLTSRSDSGTEHNKPQFIKAHRRGGSYIPGGYNFASTNSKSPLPKSRFEQLGNAFPAKKIEVASLAIKSAAQRSSVLHIERSRSSPLPTVSSHIMRQSTGRWRSNNGLHDIDLSRPLNSQYVRPALSSGERDRFQASQTKPKPKMQKQEDTEEISRRKTVTWCELTEVHEFDHADNQNKENRMEHAEEKATNGGSTDIKVEKDRKIGTASAEVFVKDDTFENQPVRPLDMDKLEIVTPLHLSKCIDTDSDISISSPSSEDSMPFTDAAEAHDIPPTPETYQHKRNSRISRDDVLSRLAELKKNRNEDESLESHNVTKLASSEKDQTEEIVDSIDAIDLGRSNDKSHYAGENKDTVSADQANTQQNRIFSPGLAAATPNVSPALHIPSIEMLAESANGEPRSQLANSALDPPCQSTADVCKPTNARKLDLSEWYKQRKRMERLRREQVVNGKYDFSVEDINGLIENDETENKPLLLTENSRRATYTEGINDIIPLTTGRQAGAFEKSLLEDFQRIAEGQKPKAYRERRRSKVVVASSDFEKAGGADQAIADAIAIKTTKVATAAEPLDTYDDSAQSIHSIESTANFAPRPWVERRRSTDLLSRVTPDSPARGRLYLKIIAAQDLDFPFPSRDMVARCVLNEGTYEHTSPSRRLGRNTEFGHEFKLETHDFLEFTITIHVKHPDSDRSTTLSRILSTQRKSRAEGLSKYINNEDGALAQVRIAFQDIMSECQSKICTATFHLVNGWYKDAGLPLISGRNRIARRPIREKVVGKLLVKLVYLPGVDPLRFALPPNLEACEEALNIRRWHETCWHVGYMSQLGGDLNFWRRRFFKLVGGRLYSHTDTNHSLRSVIDLSKSEIMTVDHVIVAHSQEPHVLEMIEMLPPTDNDLHPGTKPGSITSSRMSISSESASRRNSRSNLDSDSLYCSVKNSIRITFSNGEHMDFFCDSSTERKQWVDVLKVIVGRVPEWPEWLTEGREVLNQ